MQVPPADDDRSSAPTCSANPAPGGIVTAQTAPTAAPPRKKPFYRSLFFQVIVADVAGVAIGHFWPNLGEDLKPLADGFIRLIKMVIAPLIFCVVVTGIAKVGDVKSVGRIGFKAILYFEIVTTFALLFGWVLANLFQPGSGLNIDPATLDTSAVEAATGGG